MTTRMTSKRLHINDCVALHNFTSTSTECTHARIVSLFLIIHTHIGSSSSLVRTSSTCHPCERYLFDLTSSFYLSAFLLSIFLFSFFHLSDEQQPELNKKIMENLCDSANNGGEGTYDVLYLPTGYEPNGHDFNEFQNSSVPLSFKIPVADQDVDDLTLGKMLTEAYRGQVDYFVLVQEGVSVSQLLRSDRSGQPDGDRSGQPDERESSKAQIRTLPEEQRQTILADCHARVSHHEIQAAQAEEERRLLQGQLWQQKLEFRESHQKSLNEMEELRKFQSSTFRHYCKTKISRGSGHTKTPHGERQRQRKKTGTEREEKTEEERQDKRRQKKTEERSEKILFSVWWCMAFFLLV